MWGGRELAGATKNGAAGPKRKPGGEAHPNLNACY